MKKLGFIVFTFITLLFIGMHIAPEAAANPGQNYDFNFTLVNQGNPNGDQRSLQRAFGTTTSVDTDGLGGNFGFYVYNGELITNPDQNFTISGSTNVVIVRKTSTSDVVAVFVDSNGEFLKADYNPEGGVTTAPIGLSKPGYDFVGFNNGPISEDTVFVAQYTRTAANVSVTIDDVETEYPYNSVVELTAPANFSYWADQDGQVISRDPAYKFSALSDITIQIVAEGSEAVVPHVYLTNVTGIRPDHVSLLGYIEGEFVEYGVLVSQNEEVLTLDTVGAVKVPSQSLSSETNEFLRSIPESAGYVSYRAYAIRANGDVVYSENNYLVIPGSEVVNQITGDDTFLSDNSSTTVSGDNIDITNLGLDSSLFSVNVANNSASGLGLFSELRLYGQRSDGLGSSLEIVINKGFITGIEIDFAGSTHNKAALLTLGSNEISLSDVDVTNVKQNYNDLEITSIRLQNVGIDGTSNPQIRINYIKITYVYEEIDVDLRVNTKLYETNFVLEDESSLVQSMRSGQTTTLPTEPTKEGHTFLGWFEEGSEIAFDFDTPITRHITLEARFKINEYTLTFDTDGGSPIDPITQEFGSELVAPADPIKVGYTFAVWSPALPATIPASNQTYTALWVVNEYTITFNVDGGSVVSPLTQAYGSVLVMPEIPTKDGFNFMGWFTDANRTMLFEATTMPLGNTTLYALWQDANLTSVITFEVNGGSDITPVVVNNGDAVLEPTDPSKEGYTFIGWYTDVALQFEYDFETLVSTDFTLYAKWELNVYSISFDPNDGVGDVQVKSAVHGFALVEAQRPSLPTRDEFNFVGWFDTDATSGGNEWVEGTVFTSNKLYYARWSPIPTGPTLVYTIDFSNSTSSAGSNPLTIAQLKAFIESVDSGDLVLSSVTSTNNTYIGNSAGGQSTIPQQLKTGNSSTPGAMTLVLSGNVTRVVVYGLGWTTSSGSIKVNEAAAQNFSGNTTNTLTFNFSATNTIVFTTTARTHIFKIEFFQ